MGTWVAPLLVREGFESPDIDLMLDLARGVRGRAMPKPGDSVVYDRHYAKLHELGLIQWKRVDPVYASMVDDHYVLTDKGERFVKFYRDETKRIFGVGLKRVGGR